MSSDSVTQKPSETALMTALRRALAYRAHPGTVLGSDNLAEVFLPAYFRFFLRFKAIRKNAQRRLDGYFPGMSEYLMARTAYFDRLFKEALAEHVPQIVLLGAGYDSRAYRFVGSIHRTQIFELDSAPTQNRKIQCLQRARVGMPPQIRFVAIDFNTQALAAALEEAGYLPGERTLFLWEGVSYYLEPEAVAETLAFTSRAAHPESAIAFDYTVRLTEENMADYYGAREFIQTMRAAHASEALLFSLAEGEIEPYLAQQGLRLVEHLDNAEIERRYLTGAGGELIGRMTGHFRFALAAPKST